MEDGYDKILRVVGKKHDLIGIVLDDRRESEIPKMGLFKLTDAETNEERWIDTSSTRVQQSLRKRRQEIQTKRRSLFITSRLDSVYTAIKEPVAASERALHWLEAVRIDSPRLRYDNYPYGLSGGMCQRAMVAMALAAEPRMLIADEPTTGLDATIQARIVELLEELKTRFGVTLVLISHDIGVIARLSDRIAVMYGGQVLESGPAAMLLEQSEQGHPYTHALLASLPRAKNVKHGGRLPAIEGEVLDTINVPRGCRFRERCQRIHDGIRARCTEQEPALAEVAPGHRIRCWLYQEP